MNILTSLTRFLKNKNVVTVLGIVVIIAILYFGYNQQIKSQTSPVNVPVAKQTIQPGTLITSDMVTYIKMPKIGISDNVIRSSNLIIGKYSNYNTEIPQGSMFYADVVVDEDQLPSSTFTQVKEDEIAYNLSVTTASTYGNSMFPGHSIDIYMKAVDDSGQVIVGKLLSNIEILAVKDSTGKNVFANSDETRTPAFLIFGVSYDDYILLRKTEYMNDYSVVVFPSPVGGDKVIEDTVSPTYLREFINSKTVYIPVDDNTQVDQDNNTENTTPDQNQGA